MEILDLIDQNYLYIDENIHLDLENYNKEISFLRKKRNLQLFNNNHN